jgi:pyruvate/2-oxoacid:ferredoxin oxidoreductase alpha subunit
VTWGAMVKETLQAADELEEQGVSVEVIDVATISPLDMDTIIESVERTGRCVIVQEAPEALQRGQRNRRQPGRCRDLAPARTGQARVRLRCDHAAVSQ